MTSEHSSTAYAGELAEIRRRFALMVGRTRNMVEQACEVLDTRDLAAARRLVDSDRFLDRLEVELDEKCLLALARYNPVASDLRLMITILKAVTDLERIGDLCSSSAMHLMEIGASDPPEGVELIHRLAQAALGMMRLAEQALDTEDETIALDVLTRDDELDELYRQLLEKRLTALTESQGTREAGLRMFLIARNLERIGDHCTNLAEQVIFLSRSEDVRHGAVASARKKPR